MKILITGGSGLFGSKLAEIAENEFEVYSGYRSHDPPFGKPVKLDVTGDVFGVLKDVKPDVVVHSAAMTDVDKCEIEKELAYKINAEGTKNVAEASKKLNAFMVYISTDYVFNGEKGMYKENDPTDPINYYGYTKLVGEGYCENIARTCVIYGSRPAAGKVNFVLWLIEKLEKGEEVKIVTDQYITPTLNTNLAEMVLEIIERKISGTFHLAGASRVSRYEFALEVAKVFDFDENLISPVKMSDINWIAKRPKDSSLDVTKAKETLKNKPYELKDALKVLKSELNV